MVSLLLNMKPNIHNLLKRRASTGPFHIFIASLGIPIFTQEPHQFAEPSILIHDIPSGRSVQRVLDGPAATCKARN